MRKQSKQREQRIVGDEKGPADYFEEATSPVSPESFRSAFRNFAPVQDLIVPRRTLDGFFRIADEFIRHKSATKAINKRKMLGDYQRCKRLIAIAPCKLEALQHYFSRFSHERLSRTSAVASFISKQIVALKKTLDPHLEQVSHNIDANIRLLQYAEVQAQEKQFTLELERFISHRFPDLKKAENKGDQDAREKIDALIGAARAGAGLYTAEELRNEDSLLDRIPMLRYRARKYSKKVAWDAERDEGATSWAENKRK
jgi:hypothetical protein